MNFLKSFVHPTESRRTHSLYPVYKMEDNFFIRTGLNILYYFVSLIPLPLKLLLRRNFGYRYIGIMDYALYIPILTIGAGYILIFCIFLPLFLINDAVGGISVSLSLLVHIPFLSIAFFIWLARNLWKNFKADLHSPVNRIPNHSYYSGDSKILSFNEKEQNENLQIDANYIKDHLEVKLCVVLGVLILPIDTIFGIYILLMTFCLKVESWYEVRERRLALLDLVDSIYDAEYREYVYEKISKCHNKKLPLEHIYQEMITSNNDELHKSIQRRFLENNHLSEINEKPNELSKIENLLNKIR